MADPNIALNKPATASNYVMPYSPDKAVNGVTTPFSRWLSNTVPAAMAIDLGSVNVITAWTVRHMGVAGWASPDYNMVDYSLQGSNNNSSWVTIDSVTNNTLSTTTRNVISAFRYVRLYVTKGLRTNTQYASIMELEINGHPVTANLTALGISSGTLSPAFAPATLAYTAPNVPYGTSSVTVSAVAADPTSVIKVNGTVMTGGQSTVNLNVGSNTINVLVTAIDGVTTKTYTITVIREQGAILTDLTISSGTLTPDFSSNQLNYTTQNVGYDTASVTVTSATTVAGTTITVAGNAATSGQPSTVNLNVGSNTINIVATNGGASQTYTITLIRENSLYLSKVNLNYTGNRFSYSDSVNMDHTSTAYTATVSSKATSVTLNPIDEETTATITIAGNGTSQTITSGGTSSAITLPNATNTITLSVSKTGYVSTKNYTLTINKA